MDFSYIEEKTKRNIKRIDQHTHNHQPGTRWWSLLLFFSINKTRSDITLASQSSSTPPPPHTQLSLYLHTPSAAMYIKSTNHFQTNEQTKSTITAAPLSWHPLPPACSPHPPPPLLPSGGGGACPALMPLLPPPAVCSGRSQTRRRQRRWARSSGCGPVVDEMGDDDDDEEEEGWRLSPCGIIDRLKGV
jgi:hypothetical protein